MRALVTGGLGFVGSNLVDALVKKGWKVVGMDNLCSESSSRSFMNARADYWIDDVRNLDKSKYSEEEFDVVFHLAAHARIQPSFDHPLDYLSNDIMGTASTCEFARQIGAKLVYAGSSTAFGGEYLNPYAFAKRSGERVCEMYKEVYGMSTIIARFFNVYGDRQPITGPWATVVGKFEELTKKGEALTVVGDGDQRRDFTHIDDIVSGLYELGCRDWSSFDSSLNFSLGTGTNYSINELADMFGGEKINTPPRPGEVRITLADPNLMREKTGWRTKKSLKRYVRSFVKKCKVVQKKSIINTWKYLNNLKQIFPF
jgi:UDP-glucose 4-epimerase